jgi:hypothetical protein
MIPTKTTEIGIQRIKMNPQYWVHTSVIIGESTVLGTCFSHYWRIHSIGYMLKSLLVNPQYWVHASVIIGESTVLGTCFSHYWRIHSIGYMLQSLLVNPQYWVHASVIIGRTAFQVENTSI